LLSTRDRILIALFAVQLLASLALGIGVVRGLNRPSGSELATTVGPGAQQQDGEVATDPSLGPSGEPVSAATQGTKSTTVAQSGSRASQNLGVTKDAIKVGVLVTQRGAINFQGAAQASKAYFDWVNSQGGVNGRRIVPIYADDELDSAKGLAAINKMINDDKVFAFAAWNAPLTELSVTPIINENKIPLVGCYGNGDEYKSPYVYSFEPWGYRWGLAMSSWIADLGGKKPAFIYVDNSNAFANQAWEDGFKDGFAKRGITLSPDQIYKVDVTNPDFTQQVAGMQGAGVDSLATIIDQTAHVRLALAMNRQRFKPLYVSDPMILDRSSIEDPNVGASMEGTYVASDMEWLTSQDPEVQLYVQETKRRFGSKAMINWSGEVSWLGAKMFVEGLKRAGANPTRQSLMDALNSMTDFSTGFTAPLTIRPAMHEPNHCFKLSKIANKQPQPVRDWLCTGSQAVYGR